MLKKSAIALAITSATLIAAAPSMAATGHSSKVNGGAGGTTAANAYTGALTAADGAGNATGVTPIGTITCSTATGAGSITGNGGGVFPVGGTGPVGNLTTATFTKTGSPNGYCTSTIGSLGNPYAQTTAVDNNGAAAGLWNVQGDWSAGAPKMTFTNAKVSVALRSTASPYNVIRTCVYAGALTGAVNNAAHTLTLTNAQINNSPVVSGCPANIKYSAVYNLTGAGGAFVYLTA